MMLCGFSAEEAEIGLHPSNRKKADEWPQESLKNTEILFISPERRSKRKPGGVAVSVEGEELCPGLGKQGWVLGSCQFFLQLKFSCNSLLLMLSWPWFMSYLLPFAKQKEKHILCLLAWFHVIKEGRGHAPKWHKGIKQESKLKNPKLRPSRIIKEVVKQRGNGLLVSWRTADRAG